MIRCATLALLCALAAGPAGAADILRGSASDLITFERWCADVAGYGDTRCAQRLKPDYDEFAIYRQTIERYEGEFMREQNANRELRQRVETQDILVPVQNLD